MSDDEYFTTDTQSVASEIDVSSVTRTTDDGGESSFQWKRPIAYLLGGLLAVLGVTAVVFWVLDVTPPMP